MAETIINYPETEVNLTNTFKFAYIAWTHL